MRLAREHLDESWRAEGVIRPGSDGSLNAGRLVDFLRKVLLRVGAALQNAGAVFPNGGAAISVGGPVMQIVDPP